MTTATFRVEAFDDRANQALLVPVEMQGNGADGFVRDGDQIRVYGRSRHGTLSAKAVENLSNGSVLRLSGGGSVVRIVVMTIVVLMLVAIVAGVVAGIFFGWRPPDFGGTICPPPEFPMRPPGCP